MALFLCYLQSITTPTKARLVPRLSPEVLNQESPVIQSSIEMVDDIFNEPMPLEMNEQAYEAITEELKVVQVTFQICENNGLGRTVLFYWVDVVT